MSGVPGKLSPGKTGLLGGDHLCGVYKHFVVFGGGVVRIRVTRDLSLNTLLNGVFVSPLFVPEESPGALPDEDQASKQHPHLEELRTKVAALRKQGKKSPAEYARNFHEISEIIRLCETVLSSASGQPDPLRITIGRLRWDALRALSISGQEERRALREWAAALARADGPAKTAGLLAELRDTMLQAGELGRAEMLEDKRLALLRPTLSQDEQHKELKASAFRFYPRDRQYAHSKLQPLVESFAAEPDVKKRSLLLDRLARDCRYRNVAWQLAESVHRTIERTVPVEQRGPEHFQHYFWTLKHQGKRAESIAVLKRNLEVRPDSRWDETWRRQLVVQLLGAGQTGEALEAFDALKSKYPEHDGLPNLRFLIGLTFLEKKKNPEHAREHFALVIQQHPQSYWAKCSRRALGRIKRPHPEADGP